jgi:hypothetical protein
MPPQWSARRDACLSADRRELAARQRNEDEHGREMSSAPVKTAAYLSFFNLARTIWAAVRPERIVDS